MNTTALTVAIPPPIRAFSPQSSHSYASAASSSHSHDDPIDFAASHNQTPKTHVKVRAPATLPGGSRFHAKCGKRTILATVPSGGVKKNDIFKVCITNSSNSRQS